MAAETGLLIDGQVYELPTVDSLTLDEAELMYDRCGLTQEDFVKELDETDEEHERRVAKLIRPPAYSAFLMQVAYQRGNPDAPPERVKKVLGSTNRLAAFSTLTLTVEEAGEVPLDTTSDPDRSSPSGSLERERSTKESPETSGGGSENVSVSPAGEVVNIGTTRSATSSTSVPSTSAASGRPT